MLSRLLVRRENFFNFSAFTLSTRRIPKYTWWVASSFQSASAGAHFQFSNFTILSDFISAFNLRQYILSKIPFQKFLFVRGKKLCAVGVSERCDAVHLHNTHTHSSLINLVSAITKCNHPIANRSSCFVGIALNENESNALVRWHRLSLFKKWNNYHLCRAREIIRRLSYS